jgi:hypothetical protein
MIPEKHAPDSIRVDAGFGKDQLNEKGERRVWFDAVESDSGP